MAPAFILLKSLFKLVAYKFILSTTEKNEASSAFVAKPSERLFIQIKSNNGPRMDPCGIPDSILDHKDR